MRSASFRVTAAILPTDAQNLSIEHCPTSESYLLWSYDLGRKRIYFLLLATPGRGILYDAITQVPRRSSSAKKETEEGIKDCPLKSAKLSHEKGHAMVFSAKW